MTFCILRYVCEKEGRADLCVYMRTKRLFGHCLFSRKRTKIRKKTKYTILDNIDEQERMELRPKYGTCKLSSSAHALIWSCFCCCAAAALLTDQCPVRHQ